MVERRLGRTIPDQLEPDWEIFRLDGEPYRMEEWPLVRSITSGEEVTDEEYFNVRPDGSHMFVRCSSAPIYDGPEIVAGLLVMEDVTAERLAEEEGERHAILADHLADAVVGTDPQFRLTVWNEAAERLYGFPAEEVLGRDARDVGSRDRDPSRLRLERELLETGGARAEITAFRKDGTPIEVEVLSVAVRDAAGQITGYLGIDRDITERKRAEEALQDARRQSHVILESIGDIFIHLDAQWCCTYLNQRALERVRQARGPDVMLDDLLGRSYWDVFPEMVGTPFDHEFHRAVEEQENVWFEAYSPATDAWVGVRAFPLESGLSVYARDITARKRAEREVHDRAEEQALLAELGLRALASDDLDPVLEEAVESVAQSLDAELTTIAELLPGASELRLRAGVGWHEGVIGGLTEAAPAESQWGYTVAAGVPVVSEDLRDEHRFSPSPVALDNGAVSAAGVVIHGRDRPFGVLGALSKARRAFSEPEQSFMQAVANVLALAVQRVDSESRIIEVREDERRRIARDLHDEALQDLNDALAQARPGAGDAEERLERLAPALQRVASQLRGAIYDLRLAGEENRPFPELLTALVELQRAIGTGCDIGLDVGEGTPAGPLGSSGTEILRIVGEAIINARRHSQCQQICVGVAGSATRLTIEVADDGRGFDPTLASPRGAGLKGMRERAAILDGELEIVSEPGAGTVVRLTAPLARNGGPGGERIRVLLVEDHVAMRAAIASQFDREPDFDVVGQAGSLAEALALVDEHVDVALIDLGLPDGIGSDVIKPLLMANPHAQALVLSASLDPAQAAQAIESGASAILDKTAHLDEVVDAVRRLRAGETLVDVDEVVALLRIEGSQLEHEPAVGGLTASEREVLRGLTEGLDSRAIADRLHISIRTQRNHVASILTKLGVDSQLQAVLFALRYGIVKQR